MRKAQERYKENFDRRIRFAVSVRKGDEVFINRPPSHMGTPAEQLADLPRTKLRTKAVGPYKVLDSTPNTVVVEIEGVPETVSVDRVTVAPLPRPPTSGPDPTPPTRRNTTQMALARQADEPPVPNYSGEETGRSQEPRNRREHDSVSVQALPNASQDTRAELPAATERPPREETEMEIEASAASDSISVAARNTVPEIEHGEEPSALSRPPGTESSSRAVSADPGPVDPGATQAQTDGPESGRQQGPPPTGPAHRNSARIDPPAMSKSRRLPLVGIDPTRANGTTESDTQIQVRPTETEAPQPQGESQSTTANPATESDGQRDPIQRGNPQLPKTQEWVVDRIMGHEEQADGSIEYHIRWHDTPPSGDTVEPKEHIPPAMVARYWLNVRRNNARAASRRKYTTKRARKLRA